ncbi:MAG: sulfatase-like hydrolase/transferase [Candidatus Latescibacteria bacterium]|jgi:arylsulfatase A-like enzyme|nr:sulfatase-like hydrolase/transferase [Candidatus Latescibacterota bacterium]
MNIVLIMVDQQKASSLPMYGNPTVGAPNLQRMASEGCLFKNAFTSCPLCVPARVSTFTGQYPSAHGSLNNQVLMGPNKPHLLRILKNGGYTTGLAGKNHCFTAPDLALFDDVKLAGHYGPDSSVAGDTCLQSKDFLLQSSELKGAWGSVKNPYQPEALGAHWVTDRALDFVHERAGQPFFLWYSIPDPHIPFQTCEPYSSMYPPDDLELPPRVENELHRKPQAQQIDHAVMRGDAVSDATLRDIISLYYGMNTFIDDEVGRFLSGLTRLGLDDDTVVIYVSDHGEYLGEHQMIRKSKAAYDCLIHVPLIIRAPNAVQQEIETMVSLEDIMPTILSYAGLETPATVHGRSLMPILADESFPERDYVYGEYGGHPHPLADDQTYPVCKSPLSSDFSPTMKLGGMGKMRYVRTENWKLVTYVNDQYELYDLQEDPDEMTNVYGEPGTESVTGELKDRLLEHMMVINHAGMDMGRMS